MASASCVRTQGPNHALLTTEHLCTPVHEHPCAWGLCMDTPVPWAVHGTPALNGPFATQYGTPVHRNKTILCPINRDAENTRLCKLNARTLRACPKQNLNYPM